MTERINSPADEEVTAYAAGPEIKPIPDAPYRGVEPFRFIDQQIFVARETETWNLLSNVMIYRGVLLYGGSGSGKSSMINAGLIPQALKENFLPSVLRVQPRLGQEIKIERISIQADGKPPYLPSTFARDDTVSSFDCSIADIHATLKRLERATPDVLDLSKSPEMRPLLIFDQFEEFITLFEEAAHARTANGDEVRLAQRAILEAVTDLIHDETLPIKILFVFREDYLGKLSILFENSPDLLDQYLRLLPPRVEKLQEIIRAPFKNKELSAEFTRGQRKSKGEELTKLADRIAAELREHSGGGGVNLSELQIVCRKLWESDNPAALIKKDKIVQTLIEDYWADALKKFPGELYEPAVALLSHMITSSNTRNIVSEDDLLTDEKQSFPEDLLRRALESLVQSKLIRREPRNKLYFYEIVSEYLVPWIQRLKAERDAVLERLQQREALERERNDNRKLRNWRRALIVVSALMLLSLLAAVLIELRYEKSKDATAAAKEREFEERENRMKAQSQLSSHAKVFAALQDLTSTHSEKRSEAIKQIGELAGRNELPPEAAKLLPNMILAEPDPQVAQAGRNLLSRLLLTNHANINIESQDNQDQKARADRIRFALTAKGIFVDDQYKYGGSPVNQLRYCKIAEGVLQPDAVKALLTDVDDNEWSTMEIADCGKSDKQNYYEIWFKSERRNILGDLLAIEKQWKEAKKTGEARVFRRVFADDFVNTTSAGRTYNKDEWIDVLISTANPSYTSTFSNPKLVSFGGNTATITFINRTRYDVSGTTSVTIDTDTFVKRNGAWRVLASQSSTCQPSSPCYSQ